MVLPAAAQDIPIYDLPPVDERKAVEFLRHGAPEDRDLRPLTLFLEKSWVLFGGAGQILETQIAPHLHPFQRPASTRDRLYGGWFWKIAITPMVRVRILKQRSAPVRTPSFMPMGTFQLFHLLDRKPGKPWGNIAHLLVYEARIGHHSNGQDGCVFEGTSPPDCLGADPDALIINRINGSFSTNYFRFGASYRKIWLERAGGYQTDHRALSAQVSYEWHPGWFDQLGGALEPMVAPIFGTSRWRLHVEFKFPSKRWLVAGPVGSPTRIGAWAQYVSKSEDSADCGIPGGDGVFGEPCAERYGFGVEFLHTIGSVRDPSNKGTWIDELALYVRYHRAQDYYNLGFTHLYNTLQAGISFDVGRREPFRLPDVPREVTDEEKDVRARNPGWEDEAWALYRKQNRDFVR
jgi:hypothetical protein